MKQFQKKMAALVLGGLMAMSATASAHPIRTPEGNMPMIHWAVVESTPGARLLPPASLEIPLSALQGGQAGQTAANPVRLDKKYAPRPAAPAPRSPLPLPQALAELARLLANLRVNAPGAAVPASPGES